MRNTLMIVAALILLGGLAVLNILTDQDEDIALAPAVRKDATQPPEKAKKASKSTGTSSAKIKLPTPALEKSPDLSTEKAPSFDIVRVAKDGTAVIAGRAPAGSTVELLLDGQKFVEERASNRGEWVVVIDKPLPSGQAELDLKATMPDGRVLESKSVLVIVPGEKPKSPVKRIQKKFATVVKDGAADTKKMPEKETKTALAVLLPKSGDAPARLLQKPEPKGGLSSNKLSVDTVEYDSKGNVVVTGSAPEGAKVQTYVDNKPVGVALADKDKSWQLKPDKEVSPGTHTLRVDQIDRAGKVVSRVELPFVRVARSEVLSMTIARHRVIVQPGNSLWRIARRVYGSGVRYTVIYQANDAQIRDPHMIFPGQVFDLPATN